jgi:hypothetical protein
MSKKETAVVAPEGNEEKAELTVGQQMSATLRKHRGAYKATKAASGNKSLDNGDPIATMLRGLLPEQVVALAQAILVPNEGEAIPDLGAKYAHLNKGQRRMNAGNLIRNANKRGELSKTAIKAGIKAL